MAKKKALIMFDCFGVLYARLVKSFFELYYGDPEAGRLTTLYTKDYDLGKGHFLDVAKQIAHDSNFKEEDIVEEWKTLVKRNKQLFSLVDKLREKYTVALVSNCARGQIRFIEENSESVVDHFDGVFLSCQTGIAKPDVQIYKNAINHFKTKFETIIMIDDTEENLKPLEEIGAIGIHYTDNDELRECLKALDLEF